MALLEMNKVTLIAHADRKKHCAEKTSGYRCSRNHVIRPKDLKAACASDLMTTLDSRLSDVKSSLALLRSYTEKSSFVVAKPPISREELRKMSKKFSEADTIVSEIKEFLDDLSGVKNKKQRLHNQMLHIEPYKKFDAPLENVIESDITLSFLGTLPTENAEEFDALINRIFRPRVF